MAVTFATAFPAAGASSTANFIPEIWSKKLQAKFYNSSVLPAISNTDYEGEITDAGNKVHIRTVPNVTVNDYAGTVSYEDVNGSVIDLTIDHAKYYAFKVSDIAKAQADINFQNAATNDAGEQMRMKVETDVLANIATSATTALVRTLVTKDNILDHLLAAGQALDELNIPVEGRFVVLPPKYITLLKQSDLKAAYLTGDGASPLRNGEVGTIDRFKVYSSNMLSTQNAGVDHVCLAGHPKATCFASQFVKTETVRLTETFGDGIRGLKVYGYKVILPDALVSLKMRTTA